MRNIIKAAIVLFAISATVTAALAFTNFITKDIIKDRAHTDAQNARIEVLKEAQEFKAYEGIEEIIAAQPQCNVIQEAYVGTQGNTIKGYVYQVITKGYGGDLKMMVGISLEGMITGVKIVEMSETPGLGTKAKEEPFKSQLSGFIPKKPLTVVKTKDTGADAEKNEELLAISGATITSKAVISGIQAAVDMTNEIFRREGK